MTCPPEPLKTLDVFKFGCHLEFLVEMENVFISKTIRDRVISGKFWIPRVLRTTQGPLKSVDFLKLRLPS